MNKIIFKAKNWTMTFRTRQQALDFIRKNSINPYTANILVLIGTQDVFYLGSPRADQYFGLKRKN
jgi:hypothetical protein